LRDFAGDIQNSFCHILICFTKV